MTHEKAIVINHRWAGVISSLLVMFIAATVGYAWNSNAQQAVMSEKVGRLEFAQDKTQDAVQRIGVMEVKLVGATDAMKRIEVQQDKMDEKLDKLLQNQGPRGTP